MSDTASILPGNWLGVFGGGQLGRMFVHAAQRLGYHVAVVDADADCPAAQAADRLFAIPAATNKQAEHIEQFARACQAVTLEFENISSHWVRAAAQFSLVRPSAEFLEMCQDRLLEKGSLQSAGFPTTGFVEVNESADIVRAAQALEWPIVLKTARSGYDGKGQVVVSCQEESHSAWLSLHTDRAIAEKRIDFVAEVSVICARNARGQIQTYPMFENQHSQHILDMTRCPVRDEIAPYENEARRIARGIADQFQVAGLFCVEFFVTEDGHLLINEIAPRPHNSGHLTIEAFNCSQFEQQVRAVCNLPLIEPRQIAPAAMANLLGDLWSCGEPRWQRVLEVADAHLHLYGKSSARVGRKMGHLTVLSQSAETAEREARRLRSRLVCSQVHANVTA